MNKALKFTTALGSATVALAFAASVASADTSLVNSGNDALVNTGSTTTTTVRVDSTNNATINQSSFSVANTGGNASSRNIGGGSIDTGNAVAVSDLSAQANQNQVAVSGLGGSTASTGDASIVNTGDDLTYRGGNSTNTTVRVDSRNTADINQASLGLANTGLNATSRNIDGGDINTGNAAVSHQLSAAANVNLTDIDLSGLSGNGGGNVDFVNTGDNARINAGDKVTTTVRVNSTNRANVGQFSFGLANSGLSFTSRNIDGGDVNTGNASVLSDFEVAANLNDISVALDGSGNDDELNLDIVNTGDSLRVRGGTSVNTTVVANSQNQATAAQVSVDLSNSGVNYVGRNAGNGGVNSGQAGVWSGFMADLNCNAIELDD